MVRNTRIKRKRTLRKRIRPTSVQARRGRYFAVALCFAIATMLLAQLWMAKRAGATLRIGASVVAADAKPQLFLHQSTWAGVFDKIFALPKPTVTSVTLVDEQGRSSQAHYSVMTDGKAGDGVNIALDRPESFRPGKYIVRVATASGATTKVFEQNFSWGVLALNVSSATVRPWEDVPLHLAVLDDRGGMVCDADVSITITTPAGKKEQFQTGTAVNNKWRIRSNPACAIKARTDQPDYEAHYRPSVPGAYSVHVIADTKNGQRELTDSFRVQERMPFHVKRNIFPTRIYPAAAYPVDFIVHPDAAHHGTFTELVPSSFAISAISGNGTVRSVGAEQQSITWNVDWKAGQEYRLGYTFDAPDTSPAFYQLGPFTAGTMTEARQWQIAVDATKTWDGGGGADTNWSNGLNWSDDAVPDSSSDIVFSGSSNNNSVWDASATGTVNSISITNYSGTLTITGPSNAATVTGAFSHTSTGGVTISSGTTLSVGGDFTLTTSGTVTTTGSTVTMTGISSSLNTSKTFDNFTINPSSTGTISTITNDPTVSGTLTVAADDTLSIGASRTVTSGTAGTVTLNGIIGGSGTLAVQNSNLGTGGSFGSSVTTRFDATSGNVTMPARPYGGNVDAYSNSTTASRNVTMGSGASQTITVSGNLTVTSANTQDTVLDGATNNPAVNVTTDVSFTQSSTGYPIIAAGTGTWTVTGNVNFTNGIYAPNIVVLTPTWDRTAYNATEFADDGNGGCSANPATYNCQSATATTLTVGFDNQSNGGTSCPATDTRSRAGLKFSLSSITDTATITQVVFGVKVATTNTDTINIVHSSSDSADTSSCTSGSGTGMYSRVNGTTVYTTATNWNATGVKTYDLGATAVSDTKTKLSTNDIMALGLVSSTDANSNTVNAVDNSANKPFLRVSSVPSGTTPTLVMNGSGKTLTSAGNTLYNVTLSGSITLANATHTIAGNLDMSNGTITAGTSTVLLNGTSVTLTGGGQTLNNLTVDPITAGTVTLSGSDVTVSSLLTVANGDTLSLGSGRTMTLSGSTGTTLTLTGTISGAGRLTYQNSATNFPTTGTLSSIIQFDAKNGDMNIPSRTYGGAMEALTSTSTSRAITLGTTSGQTFTFTGGLTVGDGTNAVTFQAGTYNPTINMSGNMTVKANAMYTKSSNGVNFNGTTAATYTDSTSTPQNLGAVTINKTDTVAPSTNDKVTLASSMTVDTLTIDGTSGQADTLDLGSSGYTLTLANAGATAAVLTNNGTLTVGTSTIKYSATNSVGDINVSTLAYSSLELGGTETYDLVGNQTGSNKVSGSVTIDNGAIFDATASNYNLEVGSNWTNSGTFTARSATVTFNGTTSQTVTTAGQSFYNLTLNNTGTAGSSNDDIVPSGNIVANNALTVTQGELKLSTNNPNVSTAGNVSIASTGIVTKGTGTWTFNGTTAATYTDSTSTPQNLGAVTINKTDTVAPSTNDKVTLASSMTVDTLTIDGTSGQADTLDLGSSGYTLTLANAGATAAVLTNNGTLTVGTSTIAYTATNSSGDVTVAPMSYSSLDVSGAETYTLASDVTVAGTLTIGSSSTFSVNSGVTLTHSGSSASIAGTVSGSGTLRFTDTSSGPGSNGTISTIVRYDATSANINSSTFDARTYGNRVELYSNSASSRTVTATNGTYTLSGASSHLFIIADGSGNLTLDGVNDPTMAIGGSVDYTGSGSGAESITTGSGTWTVDGDVDFSGGTLNALSGNTMIMDGSSVTLTSNGQALYNLTIPSGVITMSGDATLTNNLTISGGTLTAPSGTLTIGGSFDNDGSFVHNSGTVLFNASSGTKTIDADGTGSEAFNSLTFNGGGTWQMSTALIVGGTLTVSAGTLQTNGSALTVGGSGTMTGGTLTGSAGTVAITGAFAVSGGTFTASTGAITIGGALTVSSGTFTASSGTLTVSGTMTISGGTFAASSGGASVGGNLTVSGGTFTGSTGALDINGVLTVSAGIMTAPSGDTTVAGDFTHSGGTFSHNTGTIVLDGSDQTISGTTTFYSLEKTVTAARSITFPAAATQTIVGTLTLQGASNAVLSLRSSTSGTQWKIDPQGSRNLEFLDVQDSNNVNATKITTSGHTILNSGNNTGWAFPPNPPTNFSGTALSSTSISWTWQDASDDELGFKLLDASGTAVVTLTTPNAASTTETDLVRDTTYTRRLVAYNANGDSTPTAAVDVATNASPPSVPTLTAPGKDVLLNTLTPSFTFNRSTDADDGMGIYTLLLNANGKHPTTIALGEAISETPLSLRGVSVKGSENGIAATLTDNTLLAEGINTWKVRAMDTAGNISTSAERSFTVDITKPTMESFSVTPTISGKDASVDFLTTVQDPTLSLRVKDNLYLGKIILTFLRTRYLLGVPIGSTTERTVTYALSGAAATVNIYHATLPYGRYTVRVDLYDAAGNTSVSTRTLQLLTKEKGQQAQPGVQPPVEREKDIEHGKTPSKTPTELTLPSLEKYAHLRRERESRQLTAFFTRFLPLAKIEQLNACLARATSFVTDHARVAARDAQGWLARALGFSADQVRALADTVRQGAQCGVACTIRERQVVAAPALAQLNNVLPRFIGQTTIVTRTFHDRILGLLVTARKNRSTLATANESRLTRLLEPVVKTSRWVGVGFRVTLDGMRGRYEHPIVITNVAMVKVEPTQAIVSWHTSRQTQGKVNYGPSISYGREVLVTAFAENHRAILADLQPGTKYYFEVLARDLNGEQSFDAYYGFTTPAATP